MALQMQFGSGAINYWDNGYKLINSNANNGGPFIQGKYSTAQLVEGGYYNPETGRFPKLPPDGRIQVGRLGHASKNDPEPDAGRWVVTWQGDGEIRMKGFYENSQQVNKNRLEFDAKKGFRYIEITQTNAADPIGNFKVFKLAHEPNLDDIWAPHFVGEVSRYDIHRSMDPSATNGCQATEASQLTPFESDYYGGKVTQRPMRPLDKVGVPPQALYILARKAGVQPWVNIPAMAGSDTSSVTEASKSEYMRIGKDAPISVDKIDGILDIHVEGIKSANLPLSVAVWLELGNEHWNPGYAFGLGWAYFVGAGQALNSSSGSYGYGHRCALIFDRFQKALNRAGIPSQKWIPTLATHADDINKGRKVIAGFLDGYAKLTNPEYNISDVVIATTGYYKGMRWSSLYAPNIDSQIYYDDFIDRALHFDKSKPRAVDNTDPTLIDQIKRQYKVSIDKVADTARILYEYAKSKGLSDRMVQYESGNHDDAKSTRMTDDPMIVEFQKNIIMGEVGAQIAEYHNYRFATDFKDQDPVISKYQSVGLFGDVSGPWFEKEKLLEVAPHESLITNREWRDTLTPDGDPVVDASEDEGAQDATIIEKDIDVNDIIEVTDGTKDISLSLRVDNVPQGSSMTVKQSDGEYRIDIEIPRG